MHQMIKLLHLGLFLLLPFCNFSQGKAKSPINQCLGAINIFENNDYSLQFTGENTKSVENSYPSLVERVSGNKIWCSFIAPEDGELSFDASVMEGYIKMVIFQEGKNEICGEINNGAADIKRLQTSENYKTIGLSKSVGNGKMFSLPLTEGKKVNILFCTNEKVKKKMTLNWSFVSLVSSDSETKIVDLRDDEFASTLQIIIKDKETNQPVIGYLTIEGNKNIVGLYNGSSFYFNAGRRGTIILKCEVEGYFFNDTEIDITADKDEIIIVKLERVAQGKSIQLEEIQFDPGTSIITQSSDPKLRRLKDFLALNSELNVEIQGHVHAKGENNNANQKLSEARAKRVMKYLTANGINKARLTTIGYGNTKPIYTNPKFSHEEQANRRVEILIK